MAKITQRLDYSTHELEIKKKMKEIHDLLLKNQFGEAAGKVNFVIAELRMMRAAINSHIHD
jgi:hypothetical protein